MESPLCDPGIAFRELPKEIRRRYLGISKLSEAGLEKGARRRNVW